MRNPCVLIVEDDHEIAGIIKDALERADRMHVEIVGSGEAALKAVAAGLPDVVILDLDLPVLSGLEVCRILRSRPSGRYLPIIMLTVKGAEGDILAGFEAGADDYVVKPFSLRELTARVHAVLRPMANPENRHVAPYQGTRLSADFEASAITVDGRPVRLTPREFQLLRHLVKNRNRVVSRDKLLEQVWDYDPSVETRSVEVHVARLRSKLGTAGRQIETVVGLGYRFID